MSLDSRKWFAPPAIVLAAAAALVVCSQPSRVGSAAFAAQTTRLKIGVDLPLSGAEAAGNIPTENGVLLAIEEAGRAGFAPGYTLAPYVLDDAVEGKHDPAQGAQNVRTFIADPSVLGIVGPANSNVAKAEIPITNDAGLVQIAASTTADGLTRGPDAARLRVEHPDTTTFFRLCTLDSLQGAAGARFARKLGLNKAFIIDDNETYGKGLADVFEQKFGSAGGTIVGHEHILPTQTDFTPLLSKVRGAGADVIFYGGVSSTGGGLLRRQQVNNGFGGIVLLGGDGLSGGDFVETAGAAADGTYYTVSAPDVTRWPGAREFVAAYRARFKADPGPYSANGYAAAKIIIAALSRSIALDRGAPPNRAQVLANVAATKNFLTPVGSISFDRYGDTTGPILSLYQVEHGKARFINRTAVANTR